MRLFGVDGVVVEAAAAVEEAGRFEDQPGRLRSGRIAEFVGRRLLRPPNLTSFSVHFNIQFGVGQDPTTEGF